MKKALFVLLITTTLIAKFSYAQSEWKEFRYTNSIKDKSFEWVINYNEKTFEVQAQVTTISNEDDNGHVVNITRPEFISGMIKCAGSATPFSCIRGLLETALSDCGTNLTCDHCRMHKSCQK